MHIRFVNQMNAHVTVHVQPKHSEPSGPPWAELRPQAFVSDRWKQREYRPDILVVGGRRTPRKTFSLDVEIDGKAHDTDRRGRRDVHRGIYLAQRRIPTRRLPVSLIQRDVFAAAVIARDHLNRMAHARPRLRRAG